MWGSFLNLNHAAAIASEPAQNIVGNVNDATTEPLASAYLLEQLDHLGEMSTTSSVRSNALSDENSYKFIDPISLDVMNNPVFAAA
jgi:hypothetical protein